MKDPVRFHDECDLLGLAPSGLLRSVLPFFDHIERRSAGETSEGDRRDGGGGRARVRGSKGVTDHSVHSKVFSAIKLYQKCL